MYVEKLRLLGNHSYVPYMSSVFPLSFPVLVFLKEVKTKGICV